MANRRMIHRNLSVCEQLADCSLLARLLFTWGLPHTSDWGVLAASPRRLKAQVFPITDETADEIGKAADELVSQGLWVRFHDGESDYIYYPTFEKYQDIHKRSENARDGLPRPPGSSGVVHFPEVPGSSRKCSAKGREGKGREEKGRTTLSENANDGVSDDGSGLSTEEELQAIKEQKKQRDLSRMREQEAIFEAMLLDLSSTDRTLFDRMIAGQESEKGKSLTLLQQKNQLSTYTEQLKKHGVECWHDCCEISCSRGIYTAEFARGCVKNWKPGERRNGPQPTSSGSAAAASKPSQFARHGARNADVPHGYFTDDEWDRYDKLRSDYTQALIVEDEDTMQRIVQELGQMDTMRVERG